MSRADHDGVSLYYETEGEGPTVAFVGEAGYGAWQWGWQHAAVAGPYESLVTDLRGTGRSDAPPGPYALDDLVGDLAAVLADRSIRGAHVVGAGLGGLVALRAAETGGRVRSLALFGTSARGADLALRRLRGEDGGIGGTAFSEAFRAEQPDVVDQVAAWRAEEDADPTAFAAQVAAAEGVDFTGRLYEVTTPALVVHGSEDAVCPLDRGEALADGLPRGTFHGVRGAGHLAHVEHSRPVNDRLLAFLDDAAAR